MELGAEGVLLNTGIAHAKDPVAMARAMGQACEAGYGGAIRAHSEEIVRNREQPVGRSHRARKAAAR